MIFFPLIQTRFVEQMATTYCRESVCIINETNWTTDHLEFQFTNVVVAGQQNSKTPFKEKLLYRRTTKLVCST